MPTVLAVMAHPDDIELTCAGTLILLQRAGWTVHLATMTDVDDVTLSCDSDQKARNFAQWLLRGRQSDPLNRHR